MLASDTILQGRYRIVRKLGQGGMGSVYEAFAIRLSSSVAIKESLTESDELRHAFEREAQLLANLRHPSLTRVLDHFAEGSLQYLVMEYVPGSDLSVVLKEQPQHFPVSEVLQWADQLLQAVEYLHSHNPPVIHRDIKPANLKIGERGQIMLLDFGLAKGAAGQMNQATTANQSLVVAQPEERASDKL